MLFLILEMFPLFLLFLYIVTRNNEVSEKCVQLLFMLLQESFASGRPHRVHEKNVTEERTILFVLIIIKQYYSSKENH